MALYKRGREQNIGDFYSLERFLLPINRKKKRGEREREKKKTEKKYRESLDFLSSEYYRRNFYTVSNREIIPNLCSFQNPFSSKSLPTPMVFLLLSLVHFDLGFLNHKRSPKVRYSQREKEEN